MSEVKSYFEDYAHHHAYQRDPNSYLEILQDIKKKLPSDNLKILDLGCGDGSFFKSLKTFEINGEFVGVDLSHAMASKALKNLSSVQADLIVGDGFNLPVRKNLKFHVIHIDCVLHHLIASNRKRSKELSRKLLTLLHERLSQDGLIVVEEMYYNSFLLQNLTSRIVFYGLKFINNLHLNISRFRSEFQPGLEVNFFSETELQKLFLFISEKNHEIKRAKTKVPKFYRVFFLKDFGRVSYMVNY